MWSERRWHGIQLPCWNQKGGLGLRPLKEANITSFLNLIWRITSSHSLWAQWVKTYLLKGGTFWAVKSTTTIDSWVWRELLKYRDKAKDFHRMEVKVGQGTSFLYIPWSDMGRLIDLTGVRECIDMELRLNTCVASIISRWPRRHRYDLYAMIEDELHKKRWNIGVREDISVWKSTSDSFKPKFNTRSTWSLLRRSSPTIT